MRAISLNSLIRWLDKGDKMVLQVARVVENLDQNRQGTIEYIWEDVPIVTPWEANKEKENE